MDNLWTPPPGLVLPAGVDPALILPRVCYFPEYAYSSGLDAIELAASAGLILDPWQQLAVQLGLGETAAGKWAAFVVALIVARQNGKGSVLECLGLFWLFLDDCQLIGHSAHEYKTAMEAFRRLVALITNTDDLRRKVKKIINTNGEEGIELLSGRRMRFLARSKGAGRGFSFDRLIWDEAYALTPEQQEAQLPTMSARPNPQLWLTSSPPLDSTSGEPLFKLRRQALARSPGICFLDYGAEGSLDKLDEIDLDDRALWAATNPAYPHRIGEQTIERERAAMSDAGFARERLGVWPPDLSAGFSVIPDSVWKAARVDIEPSTARPVFTVAVSNRAGAVRASICAAFRHPSGATLVEVVARGAGTNWVIPTLRQLVEVWKPLATVIDPGSPAGSLLAIAEAEGIDVETMQSRDVAQAFGMFFDGVTDEEAPRVVHIGQRELSQALAVAGTRPLGDGHAWDARNTTEDITGLIGCTNAVWGLAKFGHAPEPVKPWVMYA